MPSMARQSLCHAKAKAAKPWLDGFPKLNAGRSRPAPAKFYCSGGLSTELGFTERMKVMIFHS